MLLPSLYLTRPPPNLDLCLQGLGLSVGELHINGITQYVLLCVGLLSISIIPEISPVLLHVSAAYPHFALFS